MRSHYMESSISINNDLRRLIFNPVFLVLFSSVIIAWLQLETSHDNWNRFYVFSSPVNSDLFFLQVLGFAFFSLGYFSYVKKTTVNKIIFYNKARFKRLSIFFLICNILTLTLSQYYMSNANMYNLYMTGTVNAIDLEEKLQNSPLGIQSLSLLIAYFYVIFFSASKLVSYKDKWFLYNNVIVILKFVGTGKLQSLLYLLAAAIFCYEKRFQLYKLITMLVSVVILFGITRIVRNPDRDFVMDGEFLMSFIGGAYFGSPLVNFNHALNNELYDIKYMFTHTLPAKIVDKSQLNYLLPDVTSPTGLFGTVYISLGFYGMIIYSFFIGLISALLYKNRYRYSFCYMFVPFLFMALAFSVMYNHFTNTVFFLLPFLFSVFLSTFCIKRP